VKRKAFTLPFVSVGAIAFLLVGWITLSSFKTNDAPIEVTISGNIHPTKHTPGQSGTITFSRFPVTVQEFTQIREMIGDKPHGAAALQIMAYEMYRHNRTIGEQCIRLNNTTNNINSSTGRLRELFGNDPNYQRPYQMAAFIKGATPQNGYNPTKPYKIEVRVNRAQKYQYSNDYQTTVLYLQVLTQGKSTGAEGVVVLQTQKPGEPSNGKYYIVMSSPGLYSSVQAASFTSPFRGLE